MERRSILARSNKELALHYFYDLLYTCHIIVYYVIANYNLSTKEESEYVHNLLLPIRYLRQTAAVS